MNDLYIARSSREKSAKGEITYLHDHELRLYTWPRSSTAHTCNGAHGGGTSACRCLPSDFFHPPTIPRSVISERAVEWWRRRVGGAAPRAGA
eukprot:6212820-Pleurochrysis_carterae.AAC.7